ncbi:hypothetical protein DFH27DRAFT_210238 [Peziza echinospora]|nr:hypothetical protein DFH27DRAFT_210238 [Peziza echinospora]
MLIMHALSWTIQEREESFRLSCRIEYCGYARENARATQEKCPVDGRVHSYPRMTIRPIPRCLTFTLSLYWLFWLSVREVVGGVLDFWHFLSIVTDIAAVVDCILSGFSIVFVYQPTSHSTTQTFSPLRISDISFTQCWLYKLLLYSGLTSGGDCTGKLFFLFFLFIYLCHTNLAFCNSVFHLVFSKYFILFYAVLECINII